MATLREAVPTAIAILSVAILFLTLIFMFRARENPTSVGEDFESFAIYGYPGHYWETRTSVHASRMIVGKIITRLISSRKDHTRSTLQPADSNSRINLADIHFYNIEGERLSLSSVLRTVRKDNTVEVPIPAVLHYFLRENITRLQAVCIRSAVQQIKPSLIFVWTDSPNGVGSSHWYRLLVSAEAGGWSRRIIMATNAQFSSNPQSRFDFDLQRLEALLVFGGIALDPNIYVAKSPRGLLSNRRPILGLNDSGDDSCRNRGLNRRMSVDVIISAPMTPMLFLWRLAILYGRDLIGTSEWTDYDASQLLELLRDAFPNLVLSNGDMYPNYGSEFAKLKSREAYFVRVPHDCL